MVSLKSGTFTFSCSTSSRLNHAVQQPVPLDTPKIRNIAFKKARNRGMTFKDTEDHCNCCY